jgi:hypothetical protein
VSTGLLQSLLALKRALVSQSAGWLAAKFADPEKGKCVAVSWLQSLLALKRAVVRSG